MPHAAVFSTTFKPMLHTLHMGNQPLRRRAVSPEVGRVWKRATTVFLSSFFLCSFFLCSLFFYSPFLYCCEYESCDLRDDD